MPTTRGALEREIDRLTERLERILSHHDVDAAHLVGIAETATAIESRAAADDRRYISTRVDWMLRQHGLSQERSDAIRIGARPAAGRR